MDITPSATTVHVDGLGYAVWVNRGSTCFETSNIPVIDISLDCALGLVAVEDPRVGSLDSLHSPRMLSNHPTLFNSSHPEIARVCLTASPLGARKPLSILNSIH